MMCNMRRYIFTCALAVALLATGTATAQINDVVEVENTYVPVIKDANKINVVPQVYQTEVKHYKVEFDDSAKAVDKFVFQPVWAAGSDATANKSTNGYAHVGLGTGGNVDGKINFGHKFTSDDILDITMLLRGFKSDIDNHEETNEWNSRFYHSEAKASFEHRFTPQSSLQASIDFGNQCYNYQPFTSSAGSFTDVSMYNSLNAATDKQHNTFADLQLQLTPLQFGKFFAGGEIGYKTFKQKYNEDLGYSDKENVLNFDGKFGYIFNDYTKFQLDFGVLNETYSGDGERYTLVYGKPHLMFVKNKWDLDLGVLIQNTTGFQSDFRIAPAVTAVCHASDKLAVVIEALGGEKSNDYRRINSISPYWQIAPMEESQLRHQFDQFDIKGGFRWRPLDALSIKAQMGYEMSENRLEMYTPADLGSNANYAPQYLYGYMFTADGSRLFGEINIDYRLKDIFGLSLYNCFNAWNHDNESRVYAAIRPSVDLNWAAKAKIIDGLYCNLSFIMQTYSNNDYSYYERPNRYDLGLGLSYVLPVSIKDVSNISVFAKGNNLLNCKFDAWDAYKAQGISALIGAAVTF